MKVDVVHGEVLAGKLPPRVAGLVVPLEVAVLQRDGWIIMWNRSSIRYSTEQLPDGSNSGITAGVAESATAR